MKRLDFCSVVVVLLAAAAGCKGDPTADLRTGVNSLALNPDLMFIDEGTTKAFEVVPRDQQLNPVAAQITVTSLDPNVITVAIDTTVPSADNAHFDYVVTAIAPGQTRIVASSGGISDTASVTVLPTAFTGALSSTTPKGGDTLVIAATPLLKFDTTADTVTTAAGLVAPIVYESAETLKVLVPFGPPSKFTITGINITYVAGLRVPLKTSAVITQTGDFWAGDTNYTTAPTIPVPITTGKTNVVTDLDAANGPHCAEFGPPSPNNSIGPCVIYKFTLADTTTLSFSTEWNSGGDMDTYVCDATGLAGCFESGGGGAGSSNPEVIPKFKYSAGTHYFVVEQFRGPTPANISVTVTHP